jgi:hypothetical protein
MKRELLIFAGLALFAVLALPAEAPAQGHGRWQQDSNWGRKCEKFVNCHDARDGRLDNRGPRRRTMTRSRFYSPYDRYRVTRNRRFERRDRVYGRQWRRN